MLLAAVGTTRRCACLPQRHVQPCWPADRQDSCWDGKLTTNDKLAARRRRLLAAPSQSVSQSVSWSTCVHFLCLQCDAAALSINRSCRWIHTSDRLMQFTAHFNHITAAAKQFILLQAFILRLVRLAGLQILNNVKFLLRYDAVECCRYVIIYSLAVIYLWIFPFVVRWYKPIRACGRFWLSSVQRVHR